MKNLLKYALALSAATVFGGAVVAPAQAATFAGSLAFSDGADDWFSEVNPGMGDTFDIEFNPFAINFVTTASGPFAGTPIPVSTVQPSVGEFAYVSSSGPEFTYELTNTLVFNFSPDSDISVSWGPGTQFMGMFNGPDSVEFMLAEDQGVLAMVDGIGPEFKVIAETLQFSDTSAPGGGTYNSQIDVGVHVPEPTALFGLGVVAAGLVTSRRQKNS